MHATPATVDAMKVHCPTCGAAPGKYCTTRGTQNQTILHPLRVHRGAATEESARIRWELLEGLPEPCDLSLNEIRDLIDRIIPE